jgi:methylated-DNA-[protein]-cysteine S-methyltransferase
VTAARSDLGDPHAALGAVRFETALGTCGVCWSEHGITQVWMPRARALALLDADAATADPPPPICDAIEAIACLLGGERRDLRSITLDERPLEPFRRRVYTAAREIAPGETVSYGELARQIGAPEAAREVGAALAQNPYPIVVPCHRVLSAGGALHGFSAPGGVATKRRMLEIERAPGFTQQTLFA